jgi:biotin operon repressor
MAQIDPYFRVYRSIASRQDLIPAEKLLLHLIAALCQNEKACCTASNEYLAEWLGCTPRHIRKLIASLDEKGVIRFLGNKKDHHRKLVMEPQFLDECKHHGTTDHIKELQCHDTGNHSTGHQGTTGPQRLILEERINKRETKGPESLTSSFSGEGPDPATFYQHAQPLPYADTWDMSTESLIPSLISSYGKEAVLAEMSRRYAEKFADSDPQVNKARAEVFARYVEWKPP